MYSLPGPGDPIRKKLYRTFDHTPTAEERTQGEHELEEKLASLQLQGRAAAGEADALGRTSRSPTTSGSSPASTPGRGTTVAGFWDVPIPVTKDIDVDPDDVVIFDAEGYPALARLPQEEQGPPRPLDRLRDRHVLLPHDGRLREPVEGLQRLPGRRRHPGDVPEQQHAAVCHQRRPFVRRDRPVDHADVVGPATPERRPRPAEPRSGRTHATDEQST